MDKSYVTEVYSTFIRMCYVPVHWIVLVLGIFMIYRMIKNRFQSKSSNKINVTVLPKLRGDFTITELHNFDGTQKDGRILIAVNGHIYDVSAEKDLYGPDQQYACFAGRDASRNLAYFNLQSIENQEYDDLLDLSAEEKECVRQWQELFRTRYRYVGKLLKNREDSTNDDEDFTDANCEVPQTIADADIKSANNDHTTNEQFAEDGIYSIKKSSETTV